MTLVGPHSGGLPCASPYPLPVSASWPSPSRRPWLADLSTDQLRSAASGKTIYLDLGAGGTFAQGGQSVLYFAADGTVLNRIPSGNIRQGTWTTKDNTMCVTRKDQPPNPCSRWDKQGEVVTIINLETGKPRGTIAKTADGNAENLKP